MRYRELYETGKSILERHRVPAADWDARLLLEAVCGTDRSTLLAHPEREVSSEEETKYLAFIEKRGERIPLQHLLGTQDFMGLSFEVNEYVLIPRPDTEILVEEVLTHLHDGMKILDLCTGSGCILISLLSFSNDCEGVGCDLSKEALAVAKANGDRLIPGKMVSWKHGDLFEPVDEKFDLIVSNPPYIATDEIEKLMPEVREHDPRMALDGGLDGLIFYRKIAEQAASYLYPGGMLFLEIGYDQGQAVTELLTQSGFEEVKVLQDYGGMDRVVLGRLPIKISEMKG